MATITLQGKEIHTNGQLPAVGETAPDFRLVAGDFSDRSLKDFAGKKKVLNIFISLATGICAESTRKFNRYAADHPDTVMLMISGDLPFASGQFCRDEGLENVVTLSMMRNKDFGTDYGVLMVDGPSEGLTARSVVVLDENDKVLHAELVPEIAQEPDYEAALKALG